MRELLEAVFLGVVQGLTEFLPVSSSGHLLLSQYFLGMDQERFGLSFDAAIHTGTVLAVVWFFWGDLLSMGRAFLRSLPRPDFSDAEVRMAYLILVATVPAALIGFFLEDFFATEVRFPWVVVFNLVFVGMLFLVAESVGRKSESASKRLGTVGNMIARLIPRGDQRNAFSYGAVELAHPFVDRGDQRLQACRLGGIADDGAQVGQIRPKIADLLGRLRHAPETLDL